MIGFLALSLMLPRLAQNGDAYRVRPPKPVPRTNEPMLPGRFKPTWDSLLSGYKAPEWFRDAKFGIWAHWTAQCVPEQGDWYARQMYIQGEPDYNYHVAHYGHPSKFGFKDIDHLWHAENWDPERLMKLYKAAGAKYFVALANHHDNFDCWDSKYQPWNSVNIGPHRDIVGTWAKLARKNGLRFGVTVHAARTWDWFDVAHGSDKTGPLAGVPYDGHLTASDGAGQWWQGYDPADLYGPYGAARTPAAHAAYEQKFFNRVMDLTSSYHPDLLYFDDGEPPTSYGLEIAANYYNQNQSWHNGDLQAVLTVKSNEDRIKKAMVLDYERGRSNWTAPEAWQTDTCIGQWHYDVNVFKNHQYKTADQVVKMLIDIVCKNGNLLLNIPLPGDGKPDSDEIQFLRQMASWMRVNGEGIFGTRPWTFPGEGPTRMRGGGFSEGGESRLGPQDFRFTKKGNTLYAFSMGWPTDGRYVIHSLAAGGFGGGSVSGVRLLGSSAKLRWSQTPEGLVVELPTQKPCDYAYCLEIQGLDVAHSQPAPPTIMVPTVKVGTDGTLHLVPHDAMLKGNVQVQSGSLENIGYWDNPDDRVSWKVDFPSAGTYEVTCQVATQGSGTSFVVDAGYGASSPISVPDTGNWDKFVTVTGRVNVGSAGPTTVTFRPAGAIGWKPMNLAGVELRERW